MKYSYRFFLRAFIIAFLTSACSEGDDMDYNKNGLFISGTEAVALQKFVVDDTPATYTVTVQSTKKMDRNITVELALAPDMVQTYNAHNKTNYFPIPDGAVELVNPQVTISAGTALSTSSSVKVISTEQFEEGRTYLIPVTIKQVEGNVEVIRSSQTIYLYVSRIMQFWAVNSNANASSNYVFPDEKMVNLTNYTIEFKCYSNVFGSGKGDGNIKRLLAIEGKNEECANMFRFGESGYDAHCLQWINPSDAGRYQSNTLFQTHQWYLISCTYDGSTFAMYVNGELDGTTTGEGKYLPFQRYEMGMSWGGYRNSQFFSGRFCEIRVWDRALSASEIQGGMCGVDPNSKGLLAYWKMNEGTGAHFADATGHGYDMDWTRTARDDRENGVMVDHDYSQFIQWISDESNKCAQ